MIPERLDQIMLSLLGAAQVTYEKEKACNTCAWAIGEDRRAFAQPGDSEGQNQSEENKAAIHALIAASVEARWIGRIDEVWVGEMDALSDSPRRGELEEKAKYDPSIRTALTIQAYDIVTDESYVYVSLLGLDEDGRETWHSSLDTNVEGHLIDVARVIAHNIPRMEESFSLEKERVYAVANALGWVALISDEAGD